MDKWVTVLTVSLPQELWVIRTKLESEGIKCFIKDELTVQSYNFYSNAVGGVKLQVLEKDEKDALAILTELGYIKDEPVEPDLLTRIDKKTANILFLNRIPVTSRIIVLTLLICLPLGVILYFVTKPSVYDSLTKTDWCVSKIFFNNNLVGPGTTQMPSFEDTNGNILTCETLNLRDDKDITLPGINSSLTSGNWKFNDDETITINADTLKTIYNGHYTVDISYNTLILKSATTTIYAYRSLSF